MTCRTLIRYMKAMSSVTSHNYPETMHKSFITNAPGIFSSLWSIAKPMMHPRTVNKFTILKGDYQEELYKCIPVQNLPVGAAAGRHVGVPGRDLSLRGGLFVLFEERGEL